MRPLLLTLVVATGSPMTTPALPAGPRSDETIAVRLIDGRVVRGRIDPRSDDRGLWLTIDRPRVRMTSVFRPEQVVEILPSSERRDDFARFAPAERTSRRRDPEPGPPVTLQAFARVAGPIVAPADEIELLVRPFDAAGRPVSVSGMLEADLYAFTAQAAGPVRIGTWARRIGPADIAPDGILVRLPFRDGVPPVVVPEGELRLRLGLSGEGVLEAAVPVVLRPPSAYRDRVERNETGRFGPTRRDIGFRTQ